MKSPAASLLTSAALLSTASAGGASTWLTWSSSAAPAPAAPEPVTWTDWVTEVETVYKTVDNYITVTATQTLPPVTVTQPPVTVTVTAVETDVQVSVSNNVVLSTVVSNNVVPTTVISNNVVVSTVAQPPPPAETVTVYITSVAVSVVQSIGTVTVTDTVTDTVTITDIVSSVATTTAPTLNGLVTCPSRTINPTYTVSTPFPTDYLWGCPVGKICRPPRINCNFEQNPPADTYYCSPDECEDIAPLPPIDDYLNNGTVNPTCAFLTPVDDYFNLNPQIFQMDFNIFNTLGNPVCPTTVSETVTTTVVSGTTFTVTVPTTVVEYSNVPVPTTVLSNVVVPTTLVSNVEVPTTIVNNVPTTVVNNVPTTIVNNVPVPTTIVNNVPVPTTVVSYENVEVPTTIYETVVVSSTWGAWNSKVTKRAELEDRDLEKRAAALYNSKCYTPCNYAVGVYQSVHLVSALCVQSGDFVRAYNSFTACTRANPVVNGAGLQDVSLARPVSFCKLAMKRTAAPEPEPTLPAFRFARG